MQQISQAIGGRIRALRKSQGLTLQQLSEKIHKSRASLSKYEAGEIVLDVETLYEISKALDVDIRQLLDACPRKIATIPPAGQHGAEPLLPGNGALLLLLRRQMPPSQGRCDPH